METIYIFVSSPGDVGAERVVSQRVIDRLAQEFSRRVEIKPYIWEHEPLVATTDFQGSIPRPSGFDIVVCVLWARLGSRLSADWKKADGSPYESGTEFEFEDAALAFQAKGSPALLVYKNMSDPTWPLKPEEVRKERLRQLEALEGFLERWSTHTDGANKFAIRSYKALDEFEEMLANHLANLIKQHPKTAKADVAPSEVVKFDAWTRGSPFVGLRAYDFDDEAIFFGRTKEIDTVRHAMVEQAKNGHAITLVFGDSGSGKSSLVRAGLIPLLSKPGVVDGVAVWRRAVLMPTDEGTASLPEMLAAAIMSPGALPELAEVGVSKEELVNVINEGPKGLHALLGAALSRVAADYQKEQHLTTQPPARLVLLVDQMEQLFTQQKRFPATDLEKLDTALAGLADGGNGLSNVWIVGTLRSEFFDQLRLLPAVVERLQGGGQVRLSPPDRNELGQIIRLPARAAGLRFEENENGELLDDALRDAAGTKGAEALPMLQFCLDQLYQAQDKRKDDLLSHDDYEKMGKLEGALAKHADQVLAATHDTASKTRCFDNAERALTALRKLTRLIATVHGVGKDAPFISRTAMAQEAKDKSGVKELAEALVAGRLLVSGDGGTWRVAHEALFKHWQLLAAMLEQERKFIDMRARADASAAQWREMKKLKDYLWSRGAPLKDALALHAESGDLAVETSEFIAASVAAGKTGVIFTWASLAGSAVLLMLAAWGGWTVLHPKAVPITSPELASLRSEAEELRDTIAKAKNALDDDNSESDTDKNEETDSRFDPEENLYERRAAARRVLNEEQPALAEILRRIVEMDPTDDAAATERIQVLLSCGMASAVEEIVDGMRKKRGVVPPAVLRMVAEATEGRGPRDLGSEYGSGSDRSSIDWKAAARYWQEYAAVAAPELKLVALTGEARAFAGLKEWKKSQQAAEVALKIDGQNAELLALQAVAMLQQGDWEQALLVWNKVDQGKSGTRESSEESAPFEHLQRRQKQLTDLTKQVRAAPRDPQLRVQRALLFARCELDEPALGDVSTAMSQMPGSAALLMLHAYFGQAAGETPAEDSLVNARGLGSSGRSTYRYRSMRSDNSEEKEPPSEAEIFWKSLNDVWTEDQRLFADAGSVVGLRTRYEKLMELNQERLALRDVDLLIPILRKQNQNSELAEALMTKARAHFSFRELGPAGIACAESLKLVPDPDGEKLLTRIQYTKLPAITDR